MSATTLSRPPDPATHDPDCDHDSAHDVSDAVAAGSSMFARHGLSNLDVVLIFTALLITSVFLPFFYSWFWTPRMMIVVAASAPGLVALLDLVRRRDRAAQFAAAGLAWAVLSALLSDETRFALIGHLFQETSVIVYAGAVGLWAMARSMSPAGQRLLVPSLVGVIGLNVAVAAMQVISQREAGYIALQGGRAVGLTPNAGLFGAYAVAGLAISIWSFARARTHRSSIRWATGALVFGIGLALSGSRISVGALVLVAAWVVVTSRRRRAVLVSAVAFAGVGIGSLMASAFGSSDALSRSGELRSGGRGELWRTGLSAFADRPLTGWGLGRYRTATQGRWSVEYVSMIADKQEIPSAHNIVVGLLVAVGLPGLVLFSIFVWHVARRARGPLALAAAGISITWLFQPAGLATLPLALLMVGAAMVSTRSLDDEDSASELDPVGPGAESNAVEDTPRWIRRAGVAGIAVGALAALWLGVADVRLSQAAAMADPDAIDAVAPTLGNDPMISFLSGRGWIVRSAIDPAGQEQAIEHMQRAVDAEPLRPYWWTELAATQGAAGRVDDAVRSAQEAIRLQPTSINAWRILAVAGGDLGDAALVAEANEQLCLLTPDECNAD